MTFETGSLVKARGRDWVVLPPVEDGWYLLKPLGGIDEEIVAISPELEPVEPARFDLPDPRQAGDARSCAILRNAARIGLRNTTGPFRSFGHIAVMPRPYQLVPLLLAMKQDIVRLLIADDVGIGKTVEALLIAKELLDRGEIRRMSILCPAPLAEQWQHELAEKFQIDAAVVLPSTINRLERGLGVAESVFNKYPFTIVSLDYIKSEKHRDNFLNHCPEMVIVDEAHTCGSPAGGRGKKQRYELVAKLARDQQRHLILVTATPHSGKEEVFRSLLRFLNPDFANLPDDLSGKEHKEQRKELANYFVQRRRGDINYYMQNETPFPERVPKEFTWKATPEWQTLFKKVLNLAKETIQSEADSSEWQKRISWWSALALLRAVSSSPAATVETLRARAPGADISNKDIAQLDSLCGQCIHDLDSSDEVMDAMPGADTGGDRSRLLELAQLANKLKGKKDPKLQQCIPHIRQLLDDGYSPVIFCRFIPTAEYLAESLRKALHKCDVDAVTGLLPPAEREERVLKLCESKKRVLVCTDCLSEGINLQNHFNAVLHYDLSWNPTRHEQREGRVDRFGQPLKYVRILTWYGSDNPMDGMILKVLLRKHTQIRQSLGISVPVPEDSEKIMEAMLQAIILGKDRPQQGSLPLPGLEDYMTKQKQKIHEEWEKAAAADQTRTRAFFAHHAIKVDEVAKIFNEENEANGAGDIEDFVCSAYKLLGGIDEPYEVNNRVIHKFSFDDLVLRKHAGLDLPANGKEIVFSMPASENRVLFTRGTPAVEKLAAYIAQTSLEPLSTPLAPRCGVMRTKAVAKRTTLLLCRFRFQITTSGSISHTNLAEECLPLAFAGSPANAEWLDEDATAKLLQALPDANIAGGQAADWIAKVEEGLPHLEAHIKEYMEQRAKALLEAHRNVRDAAKKRNLRYSVQPQGNADILAIFIYLPMLQV